MVGALGKVVSAPKAVMRTAAARMAVTVVAEKGGAKVAAAMGEARATLSRR